MQKRVQKKNIVSIVLLLFVLLLCTALAWLAPGYKAFAETANSDFSFGSFSEYDFGVVKSQSRQIANDGTKTFSVASVTVSGTSYRDDGYSGPITNEFQASAHFLDNMLNVSIRLLYEGDISATGVTVRVTYNINYITFTVIFDANGGKITNGDATQYIVKGKNATAPTVEREGYTFTGWSDTYTNIQSNKTIKAQWSINVYKVTFDLGNGSHDGGADLVQYIEHGKGATAPWTSRTGYYLSGWDTDFSYVTSTLTVRAIWSVQTFTITFNLAGGTRISGGATTQYISYGGSATAPNVQREGHDFVGWDRTFSNVTSSYTVTAQWKIKTYLVTFSLAGGTLEEGGGALSQTIEHGQAATAPLTTRTGYDFDGWDNTFDYITGTTTVIAQWKIKTFEIAFETGLGERTGGGELNQVIDYGKSATAPTVQRDGYDFDGWDRTFSNVTSSYTVTAQWKIKTYLVTFSLAGGTLGEGGGALSQTIEHGQAATAPVLATYVGYIFVEWDKVFSNITGITKVTAIWRKIANTETMVQSSLGAALSVATNQEFKYVATNTDGILKCEYKRPNSDTWLDYSSGTVISSTSEYGTYSFRAFNIQGTVSPITEIVYLVVSDFGNLSLIKDSYKYTSWYVVNLPGRIFNVVGKDNISGSYSFITYEQAENFAVTKEFAYRVSQTGNGWIYVSASNESVFLEYTDFSTLEKVVLSYAKKYVSEQQQFKLSGTNNYHTTTTSDGTADLGALTSQSIQLPSFLSMYSSLPLYQCQENFAFAKFKYQNITLNGAVTLTYVANDLSVMAGSPVEVKSGQTIRQALVAESSFFQGYYLVEESDVAGNKQSYLIYIDLEAPQLKASVTTGTTQKDILFDKEYVAAVGATNYFVSFIATSLIDSIDSFVCVYISGRNIDRIFLSADEIPVLCSDNDYYGKYSITVYDRSKNSLSFDIVIAGAEPYWTYTSLSNETKLTLTVNANDRNNAIVSLELFKIHSSGSYIPIEYDDDGTKIDFMTLSYVIRDGGKYTIRVTDLFGRTIEFQPVFYKKGLPEGTLSGVKNGGRTNTEVTFRYPAGNTLVVYLNVEGQRIIFDDYLTTYQSNTNTYLATFRATEETSFGYILLLHKADDVGIFVEYFFDISCKMPQVTIIDEKGQILGMNEATSLGFSISWSEELTVRYRMSTSLGGSFNTSPYKKNTLLTTDAVYYFSVNDDVGNSLEFTIQIKNKINYTVAGKHQVLPDKILANNALTITVLDSYSSFEVDSNNGVTFSNGDQFSEDGIYKIIVTDNYGNKLELIVEIRRGVAQVTIQDVTGAIIAANGITANGFSITWTEELTVRYSTNKPISSLSSTPYTKGTFFTADGTYYFEVKDGLGNTVEFTVEIKSKVNYQIIGKHLVLPDRLLANNALTVVVLDTFDSFDVESNNGVTFNSGDQFSAEGIYKIIIVDAHGNKLELLIEISKQVTDFMIKDTTGAVIPVDSIIANGFAVTWSGGLTARYSANRTLSSISSNSYVNGTYIMTDGIYYFELKDELGNTCEFTIRIKSKIAYEILGNYIDISGRIAANSPISVMVLDEYTEFVVKSNNGHTFTNGSQILYDGLYEVTILDAQGNTVKLTIEMSRKQPEFELVGVATGGTTKSTVRVFFDSGTSQGVLTNKGGSFVSQIQSGVEFSDHGEYFIQIIDYVGNVSTANFSIDKKVDWASSVINTQVASNIVTMTFSEPLINHQVLRDGVEVDLLESYSEVGHYIVSVEDFCQNTLEFSFEIIAPRQQSLLKILPQGQFVQNIVCNGVEIYVAPGSSSLNLSENGIYEITVSNGSQSYVIDIEIDNIAPTVVLRQDKKSAAVRLTELSKTNVTFILEKNGVIVDGYNGRTITEVGKYKLTIIDELGNCSTYDFEITFEFNSWSIVVLTAAGAVVLALIIVFVRARGKIKIK